MTDADFTRQKKRILKLADKWMKPLGLLWWNTDLVFSREPLYASEEDRKHNWHELARCEAKWEYLKATITFSVPAIEDLSDEDLERTFVHELTHILVNEMRNYSADDGICHEERVVTQLTNAFLWLRRDASGKQTSKAKKKGKQKCPR